MKPALWYSPLHPISIIKYGQYKIGYGGYVIIHTMAYEITYWVNILFDTGHMDTYIKDMLFHMMDR